MVPSQQSVIDRIMKEELVPEGEAKRRFEAMLQFLKVCATASQPVSPSSPIDSAWHAFILHTRDYANYCQEQFGRFIHHQPTDDGGRSRNLENYIRARSIAEELFGELDAEMWPRRSSSRCIGKDGANDLVGAAVGDCMDSDCHDDGHCDGS